MQDMYCTTDYPNKFMLKRHHCCTYNLYTMAELEAHLRLLRSEVRVKFTLVNAKNVPMWGRG
jgi:hypothetical protein